MRLPTSGGATSSCPAKGPGGNILAEGTAHFSTILLVEEAKGENARIDFCKRIEASYGKSRQADSERPLVKIDGQATGRHDRDLRQRWLGLLDALEPHGSRADFGGHPVVHQGVSWQSRPPRPSGFLGGDASVCRRSGRLRRFHAPVVLRGRAARVPPARSCRRRRAERAGRRPCGSKTRGPA